MPEINSISLIIMILFYFGAGISHFRNPIFFLIITPKWVLFPKTVNIIVGIVEIVLAIGLIFEKSRSISAIGIIILLILVFPANVRHLELSVKKRKNVIATVLRLPIQGLLIYWAYLFI